MNQLYARIKKSSEYEHQNDHPSFGSHFPVVVSETNEFYPVKGGVGGQYPLADVNLYLKIDGKFIRINKG